MGVHIKHTIPFHYWIRMGKNNLSFMSKTPPWEARTSLKTWFMSQRWGRAKVVYLWGVFCAADFVDIVKEIWIKVKGIRIKILYKIKLFKYSAVGINHWNILIGKFHLETEFRAMNMITEIKDVATLSCSQDFISKMGVIRDNKDTEFYYSWCQKVLKVVSKVLLMSVQTAFLPPTVRLCFHISRDSNRLKQIF